MQRETDQSNQGDRNRPPNREQGPGWNAAQHQQRSRLFTQGGGQPETGGGSQYSGNITSPTVEALSRRVQQQIEQQMRKKDEEQSRWNQMIQGKKANNVGEDSQSRDRVFDPFQAHSAHESQIRQQNIEKYQQEQNYITSYMQQQKQVMSKAHYDHMKNMEQEVTPWNQMTQEQKDATESWISRPVPDKLE